MKRIRMKLYSYFKYPLFENISGKVVKLLPGKEFEDIDVFGKT